MADFGENYVVQTPLQSSPAKRFKGALDAGLAQHTSQAAAACTGLLQRSDGLDPVGGKDAGGKDAGGKHSGGKDGGGKAAGDKDGGGKARAP